MSIEHSPQREPRKRIRRRRLAEHFGVNIRTIDGWVRRKVLAPPHYLEGSKIPFWFEDETIDRPFRNSGKRRILEDKVT
jgi:hypothetical protein